MKKVIDLKNKRSGRLIILSQAERNENGKILWLCQCDCGNFKSVSSGHLKDGSTKSCGCLRKEGNRKTHGMEGTLTYYSWGNMKSRCLDRDDKNYGGRGIKICKRWENFENFLEDMGEKPEGLTLERIDNNKGYFKENCKWATTSEQVNNRRVTTMLTFNGETLPFSEWCRKLNINYYTLRSRIYLYKWSVEKSLTTKVI